MAEHTHTWRFPNGFLKDHITLRPPGKANRYACYIQCECGAEAVAVHETHSGRRLAFFEGIKLRTPECRARLDELDA